MVSRITTFLLSGVLLGMFAPITFAQTAGPEVALPALINALKSPDENVRNQAIATLGSLGATAKPAAPALVEVAVNTRAHVPALHALVKIDFEATCQALRTLTVNNRARCKCGKVFTDVVSAAGEPIVPHLVSLLAEPAHTNNARDVLVNIGEPAMPHLIRGLSDGKEPTRAAICQAFVQMGVKAKSAAPTLEQRLSVEQGSLKVRVAQALCVVSGSHQAAFDAIHNALKSGDKTTRTTALEVLAYMRSGSKDLIPTMLQIFASDDEYLYHGALSVTANIGQPAVAPLIDALAKNDAKHGLIVLYALKNMGPTASAAIPSFIKILEGKDRNMALVAAEGLPQFGPDANRAIPHLLTMLKSDDLTLRRASAQSLVRIDREQIPHTIDPLIDAMRRDIGNERQLAMGLLASFGAAAKPAVPTLVAMLKKETLPVRFNVVNALMMIDRDQLDVSMPTLLEALQAKDDGIGMPRMTVRLLANLGPRAKNAAPVLRVLLKNSINGDNGVSSYMVIDCLKKIDASAEIMPVMIEVLNSDDQEKRDEAHYLVLDHIGVKGLASVEAALANGELRDSMEVRALVAQLRPRPKKK